MQEITNNHIKRLHGLDTLRSVAIIIVLMYHYMVVVSHENTFGFVTQIGWVGVDLFFVLSGYLIGNQLLTGINRNADFSLTHFYGRRLLRTLPNYYVVLALYFLFPTALAGTATAPLWSFLTFTQNIGMRPGETFTHSWSLCIEEQFYFVLPLILLAIFRFRNTSAFAWSVIVLGVLSSMALRGYMWSAHGHEKITGPDFWEHIYYSSFTRFDELLAGVAVAMFKHFHKSAFGKVVAHGNKVLILGILCTAAMLYLFTYHFYIDGYGFSLAMTSIGFSLLALSFSILVLAALSPGSLLYRLRIPGSASLALWSYAIYLIHKPLFQLLQKPLSSLTIDVNSGVGIAIIMGVSLCCGWLLYVSVEIPFMRLRARYFPNNTHLLPHDSSKTQVTISTTS